MNTSGWVRGYIAYNSPTDKYLSFISETIGKEFGYKSTVVIGNCKFIFLMDKYRVELSDKKAYELQELGPYALDKYILDNLKVQGLDFDKDRSQYI